MADADKIIQALYTRILDRLPQNFHLCLPLIKDVSKHTLLELEQERRNPVDDPAHYVPHGVDDSEPKWLAKSRLAIRAILFDCFTAAFPDIIRFHETCDDTFYNNKPFYFKEDKSMAEIKQKMEYFRHALQRFDNIKE